MALFTFTINPDQGDPYEVEATTRDVLQWERNTRGASLKRIMDELHIEDLYKVAYFAAVRNGLFAGTPKEFEASVDLEFEVEEAEDPTQSAR